MKKPNNNNRFRNNNNNNYNNNYSNQIYSLNYKFDSNSVAGKFSGTALELIKKYNELARDAMNNSDIVLAEIFRQYAEHYRKIVTDINDKRIIRNNISREENSEETQVEVVAEQTNKENIHTDKIEETKIETISETKYEEDIKAKRAPVRKKEFKVFEIKESKSEDSENKASNAKIRKPRNKVNEEAVTAI